ncbi:MAG: lipase maturation factor family protein [Acidobacteriota bacterium]
MPYRFRFKPQDPREAPGIYAPYQPRFEWNLWFASLADWRENDWVLRTEVALLQRQPSVLELFRADPFVGALPKAVRTIRWQYWFTDRAARRATGDWWRRQELGPFAPQVERGEDGQVRVLE